MEITGNTGNQFDGNIESCASWVTNNFAGTNEDLSNIAG